MLRAAPGEVLEGALICRRLRRGFPSREPLRGVDILTPKGDRNCALAGDQGEAAFGGGRAWMAAADERVELYSRRGRGLAPAVSPACKACANRGVTGARSYILAAPYNVGWP